jgi:hypothetical protein
MFGLGVLTLGVSGALARPAPGFITSRGGRLFAVANVLLCLWLAQWVFFEYPPTAKMVDLTISESRREAATQSALARFQQDGSLAALRSAAESGPMDERAVSIMLARIVVNRPSVFANVSIGQVLAETARQYDVHPYLLLHWSYIDSFYGEAPGGPMPFFSEINGEMFRDLVQAHLPTWFVESKLRQTLIEGPYLGSIFGDSIALKLRYALQKATYDIAISPFMNSVFSDLYLVLTEYTAEFPELFVDDDPLGDAFTRLMGHGLEAPYHAPLTIEPKGPAFYDQYREALVDFGRAAVYRLSSDFAFATKAQALVARYYSDRFEEGLGGSVWRDLSHRQQTVLLAILRDVYVPNIGKTSYNLYLVPEFNTTPINFLIDQARADMDALSSGSTIWLPKEREKLWGATGLMLRVSSEVWLRTTGVGLSGVNPTDTLDDSLDVIARNQSRID